MDNIWPMLIIGFVVFFTTAYISKKQVEDSMQRIKQETKRYCEEERKRLATESQKAETDIATKKRNMENDISRHRHALVLAQDELARRTAEFESIYREAASNLTAIPYMAGIIADYDTRGLEILACSLDWGENVARQKKVASLREIRREVKEVIASCKESEYQLAYAIQMFPALQDFLDTEFSQLPELSLADIGAENRDAAKDYLSKDEYMRLSSAERNQLALDRYRNSHKKTKWQIGRDYELYVGYKYSQKGYSIDYYGSYNGLEDLGRDLIAKKDGLTLIIQCKYWGAGKLIRENHINQLYGTMVCYCYETNTPQDTVRAVLVTNITVSDTARGFAKYLGVEIVENFTTGNYPCIKCNIGHDESGCTTKIYHLPFDQQYDSCKIDAPGEFFAMTVAEAEAAGFRRAYRWHLDNS